MNVRVVARAFRGKRAAAGADARRRAARGRATGAAGKGDDGGGAGWALWRPQAFTVLALLVSPVLAPLSARTPAAILCRLSLTASELLPLLYSLQASYERRGKLAFCKP